MKIEKKIGGCDSSSPRRQVRGKSWKIRCLGKREERPILVRKREEEQSYVVETHVFGEENILHSPRACVGKGYTSCMETFKFWKVYRNYECQLLDEMS